MTFREDAQWALVVPTSMGIRITPMNRQPAHTARQWEMQATSAESNVLGVAASLGMATKVLTAFVKDSPIARFIQDELSRRHIAHEGPRVEAGGPWGYRHQFNIADAGYGMRGPRVHNDRAGEVGRTLDVRDFDLERLFAREGVKILHLSGLIAALSPEAGVFCLRLAEEAKKTGTRISFDLNHRASFWKGRQDELRKLFTDIALLADILIGNEEDYQLALGLSGPEAGGQGVTAKIDGFQGMIAAARAAFPNARVFATTLREVTSANEHLWGAILWDGEQFQIVEPRRIPVYDRIGGGDGFVSGMLYAMLRGWSGEKWAQFGWASGALVVTLDSDYATPADEAQVWNIWEGNARVQR
ncbi:sugar kinase [Eubacteriales bacterium OttesenSCG-928-A19]|nr:sugar kinase [Eubacteriales bacterium OttesenSCG-928-A19]